MNTPLKIPLSTLVNQDEYLGFDPFTPHLRALCLGGVHVHDGGWTAGELLQRLRLIAQTEAIAVTETGGFAQLSLQLNALRISWLSSLLGCVESHLAIALLDARMGSEWLEKSLNATCEELIIWSEAHQLAQRSAPLKVWVWVELPAQSVSSTLTGELERALGRLRRLSELKQVHLICESRGAALTQLDDLKQLWRLLTEHLAEVADDERLWTEPRACVDSFVPLKAGSYYQGGGRLSPSVERPQHRVKLTRDLWVSQAPISRGLWALVMREELRSYDDEERGAEGAAGSREDHLALLPAANLSWFDALRFCNRLSALEGLEPAYEIEDHALPKVTWHRDRPGYRLLTESEWEYACRGQVTNSPTSQSITRAQRPPAWTSDRARLMTHPIAQLSPNGWGLYDCIGNVAEWCLDAYRADIYQQRVGDRLSVDPCEHDVIASERVIRGGAFDTEPYLATPSRRDACSPRQAWSSIGLRVARPLTDPLK